MRQGQQAGRQAGQNGQVDVAYLYARLCGPDMRAAIVFLRTAPTSDFVSAAKPGEGRAWQDRAKFAVKARRPSIAITRRRASYTEWFADM